MANLAWPVDLEAQPDGTVLVSFPDIPEALTEGDTVEEALAEAPDCLAAALEGYVECRRPLPQPSPACGRPLVAPPATLAAEVALYGALSRSRT